MYVSGGTIDITVHEVQFDGHLKELYHANGGAWGGTFVDQVSEQYALHSRPQSILLWSYYNHLYVFCLVIYETIL